MKSQNDPMHFTQGLLTLANRLLGEIGLKKPDNIEDAATLVLTHIVTGAQTKAGHIPVSGFFGKSEAIVGAIFLCFVSSPIIIFLDQEGIKLSINDIVARAGLAVFQYYKEEDAAKIISSGMEQYKAIIHAGTNWTNIQEFSDTVNKLVYLYLTSGDEKCISLFSEMYMTIFNAQEKQEK